MAARKKPSLSEQVVVSREAWSNIVLRLMITDRQNEELKENTAILEYEVLSRGDQVFHAHNRLGKLERQIQAALHEAEADRVAALEDSRSWKKLAEEARDLLVEQGELLAVAVSAANAAPAQITMARNQGREDVLEMVRAYGNSSALGVFAGLSGTMTARALSQSLERRDEAAKAKEDQSHEGHEHTLPTADYEHTPLSIV